MTETFIAFNVFYKNNDLWEVPKLDMKNVNLMHIPTPRLSESLKQIQPANYGSLQDKHE